jgi:hypothetical protein
MVGGGGDCAGRLFINWIQAGTFTKEMAIALMGVGAQALTS